MIKEQKTIRLESYQIKRVQEACKHSGHNFSEAIRIVLWLIEHEKVHVNKSELREDELKLWERL